MTVIAASLPARATQKSWVGLKTVPSATSPVTKGQPSVPPVANFRKPAARPGAEALADDLLEAGPQEDDRR